MSAKSKSAKRKASASFRHATRNRQRFNNEPRYQRELRKCGGDWRELSPYELLVDAACEARRADREAGIILADSEYFSFAV